MKGKCFIVVRKMAILTLMVVSIFVLFTLFINGQLNAKSPGITQKLATRKIVKFKEVTSFDLSGTIVQGKARTPEIFYIFQRKRSKGGALLAVPKDLTIHHQRTLEKVREILIP